MRFEIAFTPSIDHYNSMYKLNIILEAFQKNMRLEIFFQCVDHQKNDFIQQNIKTRYHFEKMKINITKKKSSTAT
jgi:hypothetical protein